MMSDGGQADGGRFMTQRRLAARLACAALVILVAALSLVASVQEVLRSGRPVSTGGPVVQLAVIVIAVAAIYMAVTVKGYLDETRPPRNAIICPSCANRAATFDRRCRRCGGRLDLQIRADDRLHD